MKDGPALFRCVPFPILSSFIITRHRVVYAVVRSFVKTSRWRTLSCMRASGRIKVRNVVPIALKLNSRYATQCTMHI